MICSNKRHLIKKRFLSPIPKVFGPRGGKLCHERGPRGYLRKPLKGTIVGEQVDPSRILQAYYAEGHANLCQSLQQVSEIRQCHQTTLRGTHPYDGPVAIRLMGIRYHGSYPNSSQAAKVPSSWHRLLPQMRGNRSLSHYQGKEYSEFCLEQHHL